MSTLPLHKNDEIITFTSNGDEGQEPSSTVDENSQDNTGDENDNELKKQAKKTTIMTGLVMALSVSQFGLLVTGMATTSSMIVFLSGITGLCVSTTTGYKQYLLQSIESLCLVHNRIRHEVNRIKVENGVLTENMNGLEGNLGRLVEVEEQLKLMAEKQGLTADKLIRLVKENSETIDEQKKLLKSNFQQQLLRTILGSDRDRDFNIDDKEAKMIAKQMKRQSNVPFDEEWLMQSLLSTKGDMGKLLGLIREYDPLSPDDTDVRRGREETPN